MPRQKTESKERKFFELPENFEVKNVKYNEEHDIYFFNLIIDGAFFANLKFVYSKKKEAYFLSFPSVKYTDKNGEEKYFDIYKLFMSDDNVLKLYHAVDSLV